jgi:phosphoenolpyruvate carboxykinase (GTP)
MRRPLTDCPRFFHVNWFRTDDQGKFLWPGFGDNMRVLEWIVSRCTGHGAAVETTLGWMPRPADFNLQGLDMTPEQFQALQSVDKDALQKELLSQQELFLKLGADMPKEMLFQRELLASRLW